MIYCWAILVAPRITGHISRIFIIGYSREMPSRHRYLEFSEFVRLCVGWFCIRMSLLGSNSPHNIERLFISISKYCTTPTHATANRWMRVCNTSFVSGAWPRRTITHAQRSRGGFPDRHWRKRWYPYYCAIVCTGAWAILSQPTTTKCYSCGQEYQGVYTCII